ncbi:alpha/beta hydrolase [Paenibacillus pinihumi]|uniref:alpha/beta hydrolase n=1 Tax=Paenibacillus pinihumi TaxID=669462 RepID=UPI000404BE78|nr:alpha/beta hydrolase [Paenibacillus pinihumi]
MFLTVILSIIGVLILLLIALSFYFYRVAVARVSKSFLNNDPGLKLNPNIKIDLDEERKWWSEQPFQYWEQTSGDGLKLKAYYLPAAKPTARTAILSHGYSGDASIMKSFAKLYHETYGMNVLLPDARGHGISEGRYIGFGWHERLDYLQWIQLVLDRFGPQSEIILHGVSMGGATVMMTSGEKLPKQVKCIIEDCGYTSVMDELSYQLKRLYHLPPFPLLQATSLLTRIRAGYFFGEASAIKQVQKTEKPMLFIHGDKDTFVPSSMVYPLYESCKTSKQLLVVPDAGHGEAYLVDPESYKRELTAFLQKHMTGHEPGTA